jgi:hypothetical protein
MIIEKGDVKFDGSDINSTLVYLSASDNAEIKNTAFRGQESLYLLGLETSLLLTDCLFLNVSNMTILRSYMVRNHFFHSNFYLSNSTVTSGDFKNSSLIIMDSLNLSNAPFRILK